MLSGSVPKGALRVLAPPKIVPDVPALNTKVKAILRVRPTLSHEPVCSSNLLRTDEFAKTAKIVNPRNPNETLSYSFDGCYGPETGQWRIFVQDLVPIVEQVLQGFNATVFAYGNTGAGKTHTMEGNQSAPGIIPLTVQFLFESLKKRKSGQTSIEVSYLEIYREKVYDLLAANPTATDLPIREDLNHAIVIPELTQMSISSLAEFEKVWARGVGNRRTAATKLNAHSSRSHSCLTLYIPVSESAKAKLHLIDLAGSEDNRRTANSGERLMESGAINKSLFVLGQVVDALNTNASRIPYRDSKLTRLLQDSLGGNTIALIIANVAPTEAFLCDTCNTLNFASKSRLIENGIQNVEDLQKKREGALRERNKSSSPLTISSSIDSKPLKRRKMVCMDDEQENNPFEQKQPANLQQMILERRIEEKVAQKLREISKGTILSPLLKGDPSLLAKRLGASPLRSRLTETRTSTKPKRIRKINDEPLDPQVAQLLPHVEPELLRIINYGTAKEIKELREIGAKRAQSLIEHRQATGEIKALGDLVAAGLMTNKVLGKIVIANSLAHVDFVPNNPIKSAPVPNNTSCRHNPIILSEDDFF